MKNDFINSLITAPFNELWEVKTASDLKAILESQTSYCHFFNRKTLKYFNEKMSDFKISRGIIQNNSKQEFTILLTSKRKLYFFYRNPQTNQVCVLRTADPYSFETIASRHMKQFISYWHANNRSSASANRLAI